jgi:hypothetical protein
MTEQTPEPIDETAVEPEKTTNDLTEQDDVWVDENQADEAEPDYGHTVADEDEPADEDAVPAEGGAQ